MRVLLEDAGSRLTSPSVKRNSSTTSTVADRPVAFAVHVCVVTCTDAVVAAEDPGSSMTRVQCWPKAAPIDAIPSCP